MICQDCQGRGYPALAPGGVAFPCRMCNGSGIAACCEGAVPGDDTVVLRLPSERRLLLRQELYHAVHTLEAQARQASPRGNRQRALCQRAEHLRARRGSARMSEPLGRAADHLEAFRLDAAALAEIDRHIAAAPALPEPCGLVSILKSASPDATVGIREAIALLAIHRHCSAAAAQDELFAAMRSGELEV